MQNMWPLPDLPPHPVLVCHLILTRIINQDHTGYVTMGPSLAWLSKKLTYRGLLTRHNEQSRDHNLYILKSTLSDRGCTSTRSTCSWYAPALPTSKPFEGFVECFNLIYAYLSVQYLDIHTLKCAYILLTFQSQCNMTFIHWMFPLILGVKVLHA